MNAEIRNIEIQALRIDPMNVRKKYAPEGIKQLATSIKETGGIKQSLLVREGPEEGVIFVTAGGRRLKALQQLIKQKHIKQTDTVPCIVSNDDDAHALESSLVENVIREGMDPVAEFEAFAKLHKAGASVKDIAARFGVSERLVKQRLSLAGLHKDILKAINEGTVSLAAAQAFTLAPNKKAQADYLAQAEYQHNLNENNIRQAFTDAHVSQNSHLAALIGLEAYNKAGGVIVGDLFSDSTYWTSAKIIEDLKASRFDEMKEQYLAEGWAFIAKREDYAEYYSLNREYPKQGEPTEEQAAEIAKLEAIIEDEGCTDEEYQAANDRDREIGQELTQFTDDQKSHSGVVVDLERGQVDFGIIDPKSAQPLKSDHNEAEGSKVEKDPMSISASLQQRLSVAMTGGLRSAMINPDNEHKTLALLCASLVVNWEGREITPIALDVRQRLNDRPDYEFGREPEFAKVFELYCSLTTPKLITEIALYSARLADVSDNFIGMADTNRDLVIEAFAPDPTAEFDAEDYVKSTSKAVLLALLKDIRGHERTKEFGNTKKADLAKLALEDVKSEQGQKWLPPQLRTASYQGPSND